jgi:hypothetical protein
VFPNAHHGPAFVAEESVYFSVTNFVSGKFRQPVCRAIFWPSSMLGATVPETTVYENGGF